MKAMAIGFFALLASASTSAAAAADAMLEPFVAEYDVRYGRMAVGTSRTELSGTGATWTMESTSTATGFARVIASGKLKQRSEFELLPDGPRPVTYHFDDGTTRTSRDVSLEFDWQAGRVRELPHDRSIHRFWSGKRSEGRGDCARLGAGVISSSPVAGFERSVWLTQGTVLDGSDDDSGRVLEAAGPGAAMAYDANYQRRRPKFDELPDAAVWRTSVEEVDPDVRHLEMHRGHLTELNRHDRKVMTAPIAIALSRSGTAAHWRDPPHVGRGGRCDRGRLSTCRQ